MSQLPEVFSRVSWDTPRFCRDYLLDLFGGKIPYGVHGPVDEVVLGENLDGPHPQINEEMFEWEALYEAVLAARGSFTMIELGCGYGRWLLAAAGALKRAQPGMPGTFIGVEAEPTHYRWACEVATLNDMPGRMIHAAVNSDDGEADFVVLDDPGREYGQSLIYPWTEQWLQDHGMHYKLQKVPTVSLSTLLRDLDQVDLIDSDVQGAEADVFEAAAEAVDRKVSRVFIETHGLPLEERLRALFARLDWRCQHSYSPYQANETPYGTFNFGGGVLVYWNPRFSRLHSIQGSERLDEGHALAIKVERTKRPPDQSQI